MTRYFSRPRAASPADAEWSNWVPDPMLPHLDVPDHTPVNTGLVDHRGDPIMRGPNAVGFHKPGERA